MKRATPWTFVLALLVGLSTGLALPESGRADDTEVYLGSSSVPATIRPNVLFILDTSGSMSGWVNGTGMDRLDNMKAALRTILDTINNVNVGLMRFTDPGGPILYPVSYIDEDVSVVEQAGDPTSTDVIVRIDQDSDDAEENKAIDIATLIDRADLDAKLLLTPGKMDTTGLVLDMVETQATVSSGGTTFTKQVNRDNDDAEEVSGGTIRLGDNKIGIGFGSGSPQHVGVRFRKVAIPQGATIISATVEFKNKDNKTNTNFSLRIQGHDVDDAPTFNNSLFNISNRVSVANGTSAFVDWNNPAPWTGNNWYPTPDISNIVQEIVNRPGWNSGNDMAMIIYPTTTTDDNKSRVVNSHDKKSNRAPRINIEWTTQSTTAGLQQVGLRFNNVRVPQGTTIKSASIEFRPQQNDASGAIFEIYGQDNDNALTFSTTDNDMSNVLTRPRTSSRVDWTVAGWNTGVATSTPDLTAVVQEIVNRPGWCGNNSMAFLIQPNLDEVLNGQVGPRIADSFDSDPTNAPLLKVEYDETTIPVNACINQWAPIRLSDANDDVEEVLSNGTMDMNSSDLDFDNTKMSGMRFPGIPVNQGQQILEAYIDFTADSSHSGATTLLLNGQAVDDAPAFLNNPDNLSNRGKTSAANQVTWNPVDQTSGNVYRTPDLSAIIQEIVNRPGWAPGNALAIIQEHSSGGKRAEKTTTDGAQAPVLRIRVNGMLANGGLTGKTVRTELKEIVDNLDHIGNTPVVDTLYEAARYFRGDSVYWGAMRGHDRDGTYDPEPNTSDNNNNVRQNSRVSHASSYTGGTVNQPGNCDPNNLNHIDCISETITGSPVYTSPITNSCQENHIIVLTDGFANHNHSEDLIKTYTGVGTCTEGNADENCGRDLAKFLNTTDNSPEAGDQYIRVHTIGFNFTSQWLKDVANDGGGDFKEANTADELASEILASFSTILSRTSSFATPSLSVNAFNKLEHNTDVYFSLFKPDKSVRWDGNVKKYQLCDDSGVCTVGKVLDETGALAIAEVSAPPEEEGRILTTASSFWDTMQDGNNIKDGGSGRQVPVPNGAPSRVVLTYTDNTNPPDNTVLDTAEHHVLDTDDDGILDGLTGTTAANRQLTQELFGEAAPFPSTDTERKDLIAWMRGEDVDGLEDTSVPNPMPAGLRYPLNDPLHSEPVAITFGGTSTDPVIKLVVGTNGGGISLTNAYNGVEEWIFYPQATLADQPQLKSNFNGNHVYGIDGSPSVWVNDRDGDGIITPGSDIDSDGVIEANEGDFVRVFIGMRRGGRNIYALDLIPNTGLQASDKGDVTDVKPTYMWRIDGNTMPDFQALGDTWSKPKLIYMDFGTSTANETERRPVLVFGGGYDTIQDGFDTSSPFSDQFGPGGDGGAIYFVDPYTGARLFVISSVDHSTTEQVQVTAMQYPIPSDITVMDTNDDGATDRLYVGDTGGQMWRVDLSADLAVSSAGVEAIVGMVATVSSSGDASDKRKFFYPPDVVRVHSGTYNTNGDKYDLLTVTTGNRSHPLGEATQDRLYAFKDENFYGLSDTDSDGLADPMNTLQGPLVSPATVGDLVDHTDVIDFTVQSNIDALTASKGWYIDLEAPGEKGLAKTTVTAGRLAFTTYLPQGVANLGTCSLAEGAGALYEIDVLTGAPVQNFDGIGNDTNLTKSDRSTPLGSGIPSQVVPVFIDGKILYLVGTSGGATSFDPGINFPRFKSVWFKDRF